MRTCFLTTLAAAAAVLLYGCTTSRCYSVPHDRLIAAAVKALAAEAAVKPEQIQRTDKEELGGRLTVLEAPYIEYSKVEVRIDSRGKFADAPELTVEITTAKDKTFYTRHRDMEERVHEAILLSLRARQHGEESKPTALPPAAPPKPAEAPPQPAPTPKEEPKKEVKTTS
ncbi:MAG: hypothetical protein ABSE73_10940 [Planctomycetota bacterium]